MTPTVEAVNKLSRVRAHLINHGVILGEYTPNRHVRIMLDPRQALMTGGILTDVGEIIWEKIKKYNPTVIYGTGFGSLNLLLTTQIAAEKDSVALKSLVSRKERKDTNMRRLVEGPRPDPNERAVFIDDNMNSGDSFKQTLKDLETEGIGVNTVAVALFYDFWTFKGSRRLELLGTPVERVFKRHDIGDTRIDEVPALTRGVHWRNLAANQWDKAWNNTQPLIDNDLVFYANDRHEIYCHDLEAGNIRWTYTGSNTRREKGLGIGLSLSDGCLYFGSYDGTVSKLDANSGEVLWQKYVDMFIHSVPYIDTERNQLYIGTEGGIQNKRGDIVCLDITTGETKWRQPTEDVVPASPILYKDMVICGSNDGHLYALDPVSGTVIWKTKNLGVVKGRPNFINNTLLVSTQNGKLHGLDTKGKVLWSRSCGKSTHHQFLSVHRESGLVYTVNSDGMAAAYNEQGNQIWIRRLRGNGSWNLTLRGHDLIIITVDGHACQLDPFTGKKLKSNWIKSKVRCSCDFNNRFIAVNTTTKGLHIFRRTDD